MSAWLCPTCQARLGRGEAVQLTFDLRNEEPPAPGRCWGCGVRRLRAVPNEAPPDGSVASTVASTGPDDPGR